MKYIGGALKYVFKNFIFIFPFALLPSYFFAAALDLESLELIVRKLLAADSDVAFIAVFNSFSLINGPRWVFGVISFACMAVCMPMLFCFYRKAYAHRGAFFQRGRKAHQLLFPDDARHADHCSGDL